MIAAIVVTLVGIMCLAILALREDARQRRVDRQLAVALPRDADESPAQRSLRRQQGRPWRDDLLRILFNYERNAPRVWPMKYVILIGCGAAAVTLVGGRLLLPFWLLPIATLVDGALVVRVLLGWQQHRYADRLLRQLPDTMELIVSAVRAGLPIAEACRAVSREMREPTKGEFALVMDEVALGRQPEEALRSVFNRTHVAEYAMFSVTLAVQSKAGGRLAETLQTLGDTVRERVALAGRARALSAEAKLSARVLSCLPFLAGTGLYLERPESMYPLFYEPRGRMLLTLGLTSLALGVLTMRRMIRKGTTV
jgi:tight adherence protein B